MAFDRRSFGLAAAGLASSRLLASPALAQGGSTGGITGPLVLYTSQLEPDAAQTVEAFRARHPGVTVEWIRAGTGQIMTRLRAEIAAGQPRPDVLLLADSLTFEGLRSEGRLRPSPEVQLGGTPPAQVDAARGYFATKLITTGIVHHARAPFVPKAWTDLLDPRARNQVAMPSPAVSGAAAIHVTALAQNPALGWSYVERLVQNGVQARGGNGPVMQAVAGAERAFGIAIDYLPIREAARGAPVRFVFPEDGVSAITEPAAILSTARNVPAAIAFLDFLLSREGQQLASRQGFLPIDPEVAPPAGFPDPKSIRIMPLDAARAAADQAEILRRFAALTGG
ncbi:ABC transporter substrate-binding protein [Falsiroseomonas tokyonensis]|uniref:ABC transporter substrate-binding protein n=1 Tax=Falsiroseomonas tokyonensis TaxID=430521 RepID=A0ABV7BRQ9_9PROT|nr:ABC transporter substrate-binding protein [Falsiroseomonas tokyonensis]MBU8537898.1 ABC transporter substrate-binding protein [Falsiroseomonas tokyonensis]